MGSSSPRPSTRSARCGARRSASATCARSTTCTPGSCGIPHGELDQAGGGAAAGSLADALEQTIATARAGQLKQLDEDLDLGQVLEHAATSGERSSELGRGHGTGLPTGRLPDRGVDRPPYPDEVQHARRYATRLRQAITQATRQIDKRTPGGRFDGRAYTRGRAVPGIRTGGGTAFAGDAIELVSDQLEMTNPRRPRFVYVRSDGGWSDTRAGVDRIRQLAELGVPTIHLSIGIAPLSVECDRITVITDPAQALDHIAADTVAALSTRQRRPRGR
jgi:hypothetical protein